MKNLYIISILGLTTFLLNFNNTSFVKKCPAIPPIKNFNVEEYLGNWHEVLHSKDFIWDYGCEYIQANYTLDIDNNLIVNNSCYRFGKEVSAIGKGTYQDGGKFFVSFGLFSAPYEIAYIDEDYENSIIVSCIDLPLFKPYVWLLSRQPYMFNYTLNNYLEKIENLGFNKKDLIINKGDM
jgi:apolipoprotein D and lipocalin family protein